MSVVALTAFLTITDKDGNDPVSFTSIEGTTLSLSKFQNGKHAVVNGHSYLSFIYQGAAMNRSGDNLEASIILANNPLSMSYVTEFVDKKYYIEVQTWLMSSDFERRTDGLLTKEYWLVAGMGYDTQTIELSLSSAIDAVGANAPQQILTEERCSHLPLTGQIQNL